MKLKKIMRLYKIIFGFIILLIIFFITLLFIQFPSTRANLLTYLGIFPTADKCQGSLELSSSGITTCTVKAKVIANGCQGINYQIREKSCSGSIKCQDNINYDSFQASCAWTVHSGVHRYVLCVNNKQKDSESVMCG